MRTVGVFSAVQCFFDPCCLLDRPHIILCQLLSPLFSISLPLYYCVWKLHKYFSWFSLISQVKGIRYTNLKPSLLSQELLRWHQHVGTYHLSQRTFQVRPGTDIIVASRFFSDSALLTCSDVRVSVQTIYISEYLHLCCWPVKWCKSRTEHIRSPARKRTEQSMWGLQ